MTTVWGSYTSTTSSGQQFRLAVNYTVSDKKITVSSFTGWSRGPIADTVTVNRGGIGGGSYNISWNGTGNFDLSGGFSYTGGYGGSYTVSASVTGIYNGLSPSVSATIKIPAKVPSTPGTPSVSNIGPTSCTVTFGASSTNNGSAITGYLLRYWKNTSASGSYTDHSFSTSRTRTVTGLTPGQSYTFAVYAKNGVGYSSMSGTKTIKTLAGAWVNVSGTWKLATPYVKVDGSWKNAVSYVKSSGSWKNTG